MSYIQGNIFLLFIDSLIHKWQSEVKKKKSEKYYL